MILVCRNEKGDDKTIPFTTDSAGKFYVKGEPNCEVYFVTESYNVISSGFVLFDGMAAKHYNLGKTMARFSKTAYYPLIVKYDLSSSGFKDGDSIFVNTDVLKLNDTVKTSITELSKPDTVYVKGDYILTNFPDSEYANGLEQKNYRSSLNLPNFFIRITHSNSNHVKKTDEFGGRVLYRCDEYPVVTVKVP